MPATDVSRGRQILTRFLALAEERLAHLTELYETGRWQRYFTKDELLDNVREAKTAVATWSLLVSTEALPSNRPVNLDWLDNGRPLPPRRPIMADVAMPSLPSQVLPRFAERPSAPEAVAASVLPNVAEPIRVDVPAAPAVQPVAAPPVLPAWQNALDYALMEQRYPLLRREG